MLWFCIQNRKTMIEWLRRRKNNPPVPITQEDKQVPPDQIYFVETTDYGIYVTNQESGLRFFRTKAGGIFWLPGPDSHFSEDVELTGSMAIYLNSIINTSLESQKK